MISNAMLRRVPRLTLMLMLMRKGLQHLLIYHGSARLEWRHNRFSRREISAEMHPTEVRLRGTVKISSSSPSLQMNGVVGYEGTRGVTVFIRVVRDVTVSH